MSYRLFTPSVPTQLPAPPTRSVTPPKELFLPHTSATPYPKTYSRTFNVSESLSPMSTASPLRRNTNETSKLRLLLSFSTPFPPTALLLGFTRCSVRTYVPSPRRCFRCQAFGHPIKYCRAPTSRCPNCGSSSHGSCSASPSFPNCLSPHPSTHSTCPAYLHKKTLHLMTTLQLSRR